MIELTQNDIKDAFTPTKEIQTPEAFVGRREELTKIVEALGEPNSFITVYGLRGVGKSSVAYQVKNIAEGDEFLKTINGLDSYFPKDGKFNFIVHYLKCDKSMNGLESIIKRILFGDDENPSLFSLTKNGDFYLKEMNKTLSLSGQAEVIGVNLGAKRDRNEKYERYMSDDFIQQFRSLIGVIKKDHLDKQGLVIILDEFDVVQNKTGFGSLVKSMSSDFLKFCIVGIADNLTELMGDHSSLTRQLSLINVPKMEPVELKAIINRAVHKISKKMDFARDAEEEIVIRANGFPYFVHLFGKNSLKQSLSLGEEIVSKETVNNVFNELASGRLNTIYDEIYHSAVKNSPQREILLRLFSESIAEEINTDDVYRTAKELGISNPSQLMKELTTPDSHESVLIKVREGCFKFHDPVFKIYSKIRSWKH